MGLRDFRLPTQSLKIPGGDVVVTGLTLAQLVRLGQSEPGVMGLVLAQLQQAQIGGGLDNQVLTALGLSFVEQFPRLIARVIVMAEATAGGSDHEEAEALQAAARLPVGTQIDLLIAIGKLTVQTEGGLGKLMETVTTALRSFNVETRRFLPVP